MVQFNYYPTHAWHPVAFSYVKCKNVLFKTRHGIQLVRDKYPIIHNNDYMTSHDIVTLVSVQVII